MTKILNEYQFGDHKKDMSEKLGVKKTSFYENTKVSQVFPRMKTNFNSINFQQQYSISLNTFKSQLKRT